MERVSARRAVRSAPKNLLSDTISTMTRDQLARRIAEIAVLRGSFTLRSGRTSSYYIDKYLFCTEPEILAALGRMFTERLPARTVRLAGAELGGIPLVSATSLASGLPCVFVRSAKKEYATAKQIEGTLNRNDRVVIIEDVATTGGQAIEAATLIDGAGAKVTTIIVAIDRQEGARANVEAAGYAFDALFTTDDLGIQKE